MIKIFKAFLPCLLLAAFFLIAIGCSSRAFGGDMDRHVRDFAQFSVNLPEGWDGDEQTGFISDDPAEYQLTLGRKDAAEDNFLAQISIFMLPNKPGTGSADAAKKLAEAQGDPTEPVEREGFWIFEGEPRSRTIKGRATTMVKTTPENMLIIIAQDPQNLGADQIMASLRGLTPLSKQLLGR